MSSIFYKILLILPSQSKHSQPIHLLCKHIRIFQKISRKHPLYPKKFHSAHLSQYQVFFASIRKAFWLSTSPANWHPEQLPVELDLEPGFLLQTVLSDTFSHSLQIMRTNTTVNNINEMQLLPIWKGNIIEH